jgi:flagellar hook-length control protein FliK
VTKKEGQDTSSSQLYQNIEIQPLDKEPNSDSEGEIEGIAAKATPNKEIASSVNKTDNSFKELDSQVSNTQVSSADVEGNLDVLKMTSNNEVASSTKEMQSEVLNKKVTTSDIKENLDPLKTAFDDKVVPSVKELGSEAANEKVTIADNKESFGGLKKVSSNETGSSVKEVASNIPNIDVVSLNKELDTEALKVVTSNETIIPDKKIDAELSKAASNNDVLSDQEGDVDTPKIMSNHDSSFIDKEFDAVELKKESSNETTLSEGKSNAEAFNVSSNQGVVSSTQESTVSSVKKEFSEEIDVSAKEPLLDNVEESPPLPETLNPILAQIETAQKVDTKVTDLKNKPSFAKEVSSLKGSKDSSLLVGKGEKVSADNILIEEGINDDKLIKEASSQPNKIDSIISSLKQDTDKPIFGVSHETHSMRATAASVSDRILNQAASNTPLMQSAALQQPIELQSKQASVMMGERIMMMLGQGKQEVTIRLDPAELGSMHIKLHVQQDQLQVAIQTQVGQSRDIIEQNLPRLREQLAQQGITLGEASVEQQSRQQGQSESQHSQSSSNVLQAKSGRSDHLVDDQSEWLATQIPLPAQGIDYYA